MRRPAVRPRPDQVAALTRGVRLPLAPIPGDFLEILAEALSQAFHDIRADSPQTVTTGNEPEVTALMQARLNEMINEDTLWRQLVNYVARGTDSISFDGSHIEKSPDLSIIRMHPPKTAGCRGLSLSGGGGVQLIGTDQASLSGYAA